MIRYIIKLIFVCIIFFTSEYAFSLPFQNGSFEENTVNFQDDYSGTPDLDIDLQNSGEMDLTGWTLTIIAGDWLDWFALNNFFRRLPMAHIL